LFYKNLGLNFTILNFPILLNFIKILNYYINNNIRLYSNIIYSNRIKGPKTLSAHELKNFKK